MPLPIGPKPISPQGQLTVPSELMAALNLRPGDKVYLQESDDYPGCLMVIPVEIASKWWDLGKAGSRQPRRDGEGDDEAANSQNGLE